MSTVEIEITPAEALRARLACPVHLPGDDTWDEARAVWNLFVDRHPVAVVVPQTARDVVDAVNAARELGLRVAPQASGHNAGATASLANTVVLRMTELKGVVINPVARRARVAAGTEWKEVTGPASQHGLAALAGSSPQVSVVGYSLGGGISWLARKHGLAADAILAFEIVTADGALRRVDPETDPELFWAVRGGGGSFGVVTTVELRLFEEPELVAGAMFFPLERAAEVVTAWRDVTATAPDALTTSMRLLAVPDDPSIPEPMRGGRFVVIDGAFAGPVADAEATLAPLRALEPFIDGWAPCEPAALSYVHMDPEEPMPAVSDSFVLAELPDQAIAEFLALTGPGSGSPLMIAELRHLGGALARPRAGQGARGPIDGQYLGYLGTAAMSPELVEAAQARGERVVAAMRRWSARTAYLNFVERPTCASAFFEAEAYDRLRAIRQAVDPDRLFVANHEIS
jgi:FAD/FMN-containing dehydrogenase